MLIKVALRREDDGTPIGHCAPTYFTCPCGTHVPVYDRQGKRVNNHPEPFVCAKCGQQFDIEGYLLEPTLHQALVDVDYAYMQLKRVDQVADCDGKASDAIQRAIDALERAHQALYVNK